MIKRTYEIFNPPTIQREYEKKWNHIQLIEIASNIFKSDFLLRTWYQLMNIVIITLIVNF